MKIPLVILPVHMDIQVPGELPASFYPTGETPMDASHLEIPESTDYMDEQPAAEMRDQAPRVSRRSLAGFLGLLGLGAVGVPATAAPMGAPLPACTMRINLTFEGQPRRHVALTAQVIQTLDGWQLQGLFSPVTEEVVAVPLDPTGSGEFTRLLTAALASEVPDPELALATRLGDWQATLARRLA